MDANMKEVLRDRRWMNYKNASDRRKQEYVDGVNAFLDFAFNNAGNNDKIRCPCVRCYLVSLHTRPIVFYHLLARGIIKDYNPWTQHGEEEDDAEDEPFACDDPMPTVIEACHPVSHRGNKVGNSHVLSDEDQDTHQRKTRNADEDVPPCEDHMPNVSEAHRLVSHGEDIGSGSFKLNVEDENVHQGNKKGGDVHRESGEDGDAPIIPLSVWRYVESSAMLKPGENTNGAGYSDQEDGTRDQEDGARDQDLSVSGDDNFNDVNYSDSPVTPVTQSGDDSDYMPNMAGQVTAECEFAEAVEEQNSGIGKKPVTRRRRRRGLTDETSPVKVELPANLGRVVGSNAHIFVKEASWLLKETLSPNVVKWKDVHPDDVAKLLEKVKKRFIFPRESHVDRALMWQFKCWFRSWRADLRRSYYNKYGTYEERLANRPPYLKEAQWKWLVDYWGSENFKKLSESNSRSRNNHRNPACSGPISIARHAYELEKESQQDPDQLPHYLKLYERQKKKTDKTWINKEAEDGYHKLVELHEKEIENHGVDNLTPSEAFTNALGHAKCRNLIGIGENPIPCEGSSSKRKRGRRAAEDVDSGQEDDEGALDIFNGEDDSFGDVNYSASPLNQPSEGLEAMAVEAAEFESVEAVNEENSGTKIKCYARHRLRRGATAETTPVKVELPANLGRVVGSNAHVFIKEASWLLKETLSPDVVKWKDVNRDDIAKLLEKVKKRFVFPKGNHVDKALLWQFKKWFRCWRADLRRAYYNKYDTYEERLAHRPPYLDEAQWKWLVDYWGSENFMKLSESNSRKRQNNKSPACAGPISIARHAYELEKKQSQQGSDEGPAYLKLFERQKRKNDGTWVNEEAEVAYNKLVELHEKMMEGNGDDNLTPSQAFTKALGRDKCRNLLGIGENPVPLEASSSKRRRRK